MEYELREVPIETVKPYPGNARTHPKKQIRKLADIIERLGFTNPVLIDEAGVLIAGHGRVAAMKILSRTTIPALVLPGLSAAAKNALRIADNKLAEDARWDRELLHIELKQLEIELPKENLDLTITGFEIGEVDQLETDLADKHDPLDDVPPVSRQAISRRGDLWLMGRHRLLCGDAREAGDLDRLMDGRLAGMAITDPPYNVRVAGIVGRGRIKHPEFAMASGEMGDDEFRAFLGQALGALAGRTRDGALAYAFMDWRHYEDLLAAGRACFGAYVNMCVWVKTNAGQGSFYRSQHELIGVFRTGAAPHQNNVELGRHGRNRSNVWTYPGVNSFGKNRLEDLAAHPTVKPVAMIADAIKDATRRGEIVLDTFCGVGTTILAAERVGRVGYGLEIEPRYVDATIGRWQLHTGKDAVHAETGLTFDETSRRAAESDDPPSPTSPAE